MIQYPLPKGSSEPWWITSDSAGRIWFVQQSPPALVMFNQQTDNFTMFLVPSSNATVEYVASDSFGNLWFTELTTNKLGELRNGTTKIIEYSIPPGQIQFGSGSQALNCGPTVVKADSSGNIWVACEFSNQIDEFFPRTAKFFSYNLPIYQSAPAGFAFDNNGNLWFTAADADMIGQAVLANLKNGTTSGISEFAPVNNTYIFSQQHEEGPLGPSVKYNSSLPTPSGIALDSSGRLWITEHVDSAFDSFNVNTRSLVKYWTSQTYDKYGYSVSFPNGIAIDSDGNIWISEHYGNKILEFNPTTNRMVEYPIPCCASDVAGPYSLTIGPNGTIWFVEISGAAIGELKPSDAASPISLNIPSPNLSIQSGSSVKAPIIVSAESGLQSVDLNVSGLTSSGAFPSGMAEFTKQSFDLSPGQTMNDTLSVSTQGLKSGSYYLTVSATDSNGTIYSQILELSVSPSSSLTSTAVYVFVIAIILSIAVVGSLVALSRRPKRVMRKRRR